MKIKIKNIILFVVALIAIDQIGGRGLDCVRNRIYASHPTADKTYYVAHDIDADIVIMGSSSAVGEYDARQIADSTGMTVYNAAISGHFTYYQCCMLRLMLTHHNPKYILWEIGDIALSDAYASMDYNEVQDIYPYYSPSPSLPREGVCEYVRSYIDKKDEWQWLRMMSRLYRHNGKIANYVSVGQNANEDSLLGFEPLPATGYKHPTLNEEVGSTEDYDASFSQTRYDSICNTIRYCQQKGVKVVVTSAPRFTKAKVRETLLFKKLVQLTQECNCEFIDFTLTDSFIKDNTRYYGDGHMNSYGAEEYMKIFIPKLKEIIE